MRDSVLVSRQLPTRGVTISRRVHGELNCDTSLSHRYFDQGFDGMGDATLTSRMEQFTPQQLAFLDAHRAGRLATADRLGQPHVVPVCYACACVTLYIQ